MLLCGIPFDISVSDAIHVALLYCEKDLIRHVQLFNIREKRSRAEHVSDVVLTSFTVVPESVI